MENSNWKTYLLSDISSMIGDGLHGTPKYDGNGDYYFINGNNLMNGSIVFKEDTKTVTEEEFLKYRKDLNDNSILISINGTIGNLSFYRNEKVVLGKSAAYVNLLDTVDKKFVYYNFKSKFFQNYLVDIATGTTIPNVPLKGLREYEIQLPPLPEQKAIASVLSSLDDKIDLLHQQNQTLEALAETLFRQWFIERCPEPVEGEAKEDWEERPLSSIANFLNGLACQKYPPKDSINRLPVLKIKDLTSGISENSDWASTDVKPEYIVRNGDVIFAWSASLMVKIWNGEDCILNQHLFKVTSEEFPKWFYYFWCKQHLREFISIAQSHATTMGHIKRSDLDEAMVLIPEEKEIEQMTIQMNPILEKIQLNNNQINSLSKLRDTLLPKLMSGEVRVKI